MSNEMDLDAVESIIDIDDPIMDMVDDAIDELEDVEFELESCTSEGDMCLVDNMADIMAGLPGFELGKEDLDCCDDDDEDPYEGINLF